MSTSADAAEVAHELALTEYPVQQPGTALQRVRPAGRLLAAYENIVRGFQEQHLRPDFEAAPARRSRPGGR